MEQEHTGRLSDEAVANGPAASLREDEEAPLTRLHPNHVKALRVHAMLFAVPLIIAALALEAAGLAFRGLALAPMAIFCVWLVLLMPVRRHNARGYDMGADRLRVVRGILFRSDTVVPFGRVQHLDVAQGPIERYYGIATLTLHTAGTHNASVSLPGLAHATALAMRETIRAHVRRETL